MDNVINFLLEYYIWILVILGVAIITVIGFLVDSNQKRKSKEKEKNNLSEVKTVEPLPETDEEKNINTVDVNNEKMIMDDNAFINEIKEQAKIEQIVNDNSKEIIEKIDNTQNNVEQQLALSEQKPHFEPREVNIPTPSLKESESNIIAPKPVNTVHINNPVQQQAYQNVAPVMAQMAQPMQQQAYQNVAPVMAQMTQPTQQQAYQNVASVTPQMAQPTQQQVYQNVASVTPQMAQPMQQQTYQNVAPVKPQVNEPEIQHIQQQSNEESQQNVTTPGIGINFVTGNNSNDDTWTL